MPANTLESPNVPESDIVDQSTGKPLISSVMSFGQAKEVWDQLVNDNRDRNSKNAAIQRKRDGEQPWKPAKLKAAGQSWRSNRPTGFMQSLLKRLLPPYKQMVDQLPKLTYSKFPSDRVGSKDQEDIFQKCITNTIREWTGWPDLITQIADEDITFGYAAASCRDEYAWKPKMHRGDEAYFYVGCPQEPDRCLHWGLKDNVYVHEVVAILKDMSSAKDAGWRVENLISKLNGGMSKEFDDYAKVEGDRVYEDLVRENNLAASFSSSVKVLKWAHIYAQDPEWGINHYIFDRDDGTPYYFKRQEYDSMSDCLSLFSAEVGDRTLHGSKGAGRALYNTHVSVEQARNLINDALHLSGLLILKKNSKPGGGNNSKPELTVSHPFAIIGEGYDVVENAQFAINAEAFFALDRHAVSQAEVQVGAFMPGQITNQDGDKATASEVNYVASIDAQIRAGILSRWADQLFGMVDQIQRRICHPDTIKAAQEILEFTRQGLQPIYERKVFERMQKAGLADNFALVKLPEYLDADSVKCCHEMMEQGLLPAQIMLLANESSRANVDDAIAAQSGVLDLVFSTFVADPAIDTVELKRSYLSTKVGAEMANRLLNVDLSPLSAVKQARTQLSELTTMLGGNDTPVDPTDDDLIHLAYIMDRTQPMIADPTISPLSSSQEFLKRVLTHGQAHIDQALNKGVKPDQLQQQQAFIDTLGQFVQQQPLDVAAQGIVDGAAGGTPLPLAPGPVAAAPAQAPGPTDFSSIRQAPDVSGPQPTPIEQAVAGVASPARPMPPG